MPSNRKRQTCKGCHYLASSVDQRGLCPGCARQKDHPARAPDGRLLSPPRRARCAVCSDYFFTTDHERLNCSHCLGKSCHGSPDASPPPDELRPALVAWHAVLQAKELPCDSDPGGRFTWCLDWRLAFPGNGAAADDSARRRIRAALDTAGRLDLIGPARRKAH